MQIEKRLTRAGLECHLMIQGFSDELKARSLIDQDDITHLPVPRLKNWITGGFFKFPVCRRISNSTVINNLLIVLFGLLHVADGVITYLGLRFAAVLEVNPLLNYFVQFFGLGCSITVLKLGIVSVIGFLYVERRKMHSCWSTATLASAVGFYLWVVSNNVFLVVGA